MSGIAAVEADNFSLLIAEELVAVTTDARLIRIERYDEIGTIIQRDAPVLISRWAKRAVHEQPQARRVHHDALLDHLPHFLRELGIHLASSGDINGASHHQPAKRHGQQRWEVGWSVTEVIHDYRILRLVILDYLNECLERPLELLEIQAVGLALDEAIEASVERYVAGRDEQSEKLRDSLREADHRKNEFLAMLAHELRNPLAPLRNCLELIRLDGTSARTMRQAREIMDRQVLQLSRLVDDLLDISRIAQGKLVLRKERLDLRPIIDQAVQMNGLFREARRHQLTVSVPSEPLWVEGDQVRLVQIVVNLLNNAVKYTPPGGRLTLTAAAEGQEVVVKVADNGVGIPAEKLATIFDMFVQLDLGVERVQGGLGIGLSLVRRLVEMHGGRITCQSPGADQGSEFVVRLPAVSDTPRSAETVPAAPKNAPGQHILIVEDEADGRESLAVLLGLLGHRVDTAEDGPRGVAAALSLKPAVALIDIGLPGLNGYEVARQVRSALGPGILLVALTGHSQPEDIQKALEAGFNAHLTKPVELSALQSILTTAPI
jgi:signal transduction histidine kinase/CheY-like chemotaxis protein